MRDLICIEHISKDPYYSVVWSTRIPQRQLASKGQGVLATLVFEERGKKTLIGFITVSAITRLVTDSFIVVILHQNKIDTCICSRAFCKARCLNLYGWYTVCIIYDKV